MFEPFLKIQLNRILLSFFLIFSGFNPALASERITSKDIIADPVTMDYIQSLGQRLVAASDIPTTRIRFFVLKNASINAYTLPNNIILINSGIIKFTDSENELAAIVAHEVAHVIQQHLQRSQEKAKLAAIPALAAAIAAAALGVTNPTAGMGALAATLAGYSQNSINFTREHEEEADRVGMEMLYRSGFDPHGMANLFRQIQHLSSYYPNDIPQYLRTHPLSQSRIADAENRADRYSKKAYKPDLFYQLIRARIRVDTSNNMHKTLVYFKKRLVKYNSVKGHKHVQLADRYGFALTLLLTKQWTSASEQAKRLIRQDPHQALYQMLYASIETASHHWQKARQILQEAIDVEPDYYPLMIQYSKALIQSGKLSLARDYLQIELQNYPKKPMLYYLFAEAQAKQHLYAQSHQTLAKLAELTGNLHTAIEQLNIAARYATKQAIKNPSIKVEINASLQHLKDKMKQHVKYT